MSQQYSLRWNNHQPNFISTFTTLLTTRTLVDVTLAAEGKQLQAHKIVLSACSTYFQALFVDNPSRHPIVILKDVTFSDLRTMVDFMYYGEVNVTEEQLPQVLETAKLLKIKGLTEMPDSTSLTRAQGSSSEFQPGDSIDSQRHSASPAASPNNKRKRRRKSSTGSTPLELLPEEGRPDDSAQLDLVRGDTITLSSLPQQRQRRDFQDERTLDNAQQTTEPHNLNVEPLPMDNNPATMAQGGQWSMMEHTYPRYNACVGAGLQQDSGMYMNNVMGGHVGGDMNAYGQTLGVAGPSPGPSCVPEQQQTPQGQQQIIQKRRRTSNPQSEEKFQHVFNEQAGLRLRRSKYFKRQNRVQPEDRELRKQVSEPVPSSAAPPLQKHDSYPQYAPKHDDRRTRTDEQEVRSLLIRTVTVIDRQGSTSGPEAPEAAGQTQRVRHTPAVRSGPPLSCNFCWNTVDECGRILRRKTQYHCPECRTNLCIVPCFHEYHDGPETDTASAR